MTEHQISGMESCGVFLAAAVKWTRACISTWLVASREYKQQPEVP